MSIQGPTHKPTMFFVLFFRKTQLLQCYVWFFQVHLTLYCLNEASRNFKTQNWRLRTFSLLFTWWQCLFFQVDQTLYFVLVFILLIVIVVLSKWTQKQRMSRNARDAKSNGSAYYFTFYFYRYLDSNHPAKPKVDILGSGSDPSVFIHIFCVSSIDFPIHLPRGH